MQEGPKDIFLKQQISSSKDRAQAYYEGHSLPSPDVSRPSQFLRAPVDEVRKISILQEDGYCHFGKSMVGTILMLTGLVLGSVFMAMESVSIPVGFVIIGSGYILYLIINCWSSTGSFLKADNKGDDLSGDLEMFKGNTGRFQFHAVCYHFQTRTYTDNNGDTSTSSQKVVTHKANEFLMPRSTIDQSGPTIIDKLDVDMIFVRFFSYYTFADEYNRMKFQDIYNNFKKRNKRDQYCDYWLDFKVNGLPERRTYYYIGNSKHSIRFYYIFLILGCSFPFSCWLQTKIKRFNVNIVKVLEM